MKLSFTKMHGCGNDYIYVNCFEREILSPETLAVTLSNRHTGIGGDGLVLILPSGKANGRMRMFNADGSEGKMCGNAIRCVGKYLYDRGIVSKPELTIDTLSGVKRLSLTLENERAVAARVDMGPAELRPEKIPAALPGDMVVNRTVPVGGTEYALTCVSMGNPHAVVFMEDIESLDLPFIGSLFEKHPLFPEGVNTEFVTVEAKNRLKMRVWERGSGETLACGTGACAAAVAAVLNGFCAKGEDITVSLRGGELVIRYSDDTVYMTGNCVEVFSGEVEI